MQKKLNMTFIAIVSIIGWPPCSPDLNPIEHLRSILKRGVYEGGEQVTSKDVLWNKLVDIARAIYSCQIKQLTSSVDKGVFRLIKKWRYVDKYINNLSLNLRDVSCVGFL